MIEIGDKSKIAFVIGEKVGEKLLVVDVYMNHERITYYDNTAFMPQFAYSVECEANAIDNNEIYEDYSFLYWGPTTDGASVRGTVENDEMNFTCELDNGKSFHCKIPSQYVISTYRSAAKAMREICA